MEVGGREERREEERRGMGEKERDGAGEENNVQRNMVREDRSRRMVRMAQDRKKEKDNGRERGGRKERGIVHLHIYMYVCVVYIYICVCVYVYGCV